MAKKIDEFVAVMNICFDLLENLEYGLKYMVDYAEKNNIPLEASFLDRVEGTLDRTHKAFREIGFPEPRYFRIKPSDERKHRDESDEDVPVPKSEYLIFTITPPVSLH